MENAIDNNVNLFWPSYLEDAINLSEIRLSAKEISDFKNTVIPNMKKIIEEKVLDNNIKENIMKSLDCYYNDGTKLYQYHKENENCHWSGKHFTFYPNGTIDPCPGHEYFKSKYQYKINYNEIDEFMKLENLNKCVKKTGLSREEYIRTLISGYVPAPRISDDVKEIIKQLRMIGNNLNQIAVIGYKTGTIDILKYKRNCLELEKNVQLILSNVTEPTRMEK